jgi:hypothetical protein
VKKLAVVVLLVVAGCQRKVEVGSVPSATPSSNASGAATAREALNLFLASAKAQDLQAMSNIWGSSSGSARTGSTMTADQLEQREIIMMKCLRHDSFTVVGETPAAGGERVFAVELKLGTLAPRTDFTATLATDGRWYVRTLDLPRLQQICQKR